jgi:hypothetical protein
MRVYTVSTLSLRSLATSEAVSNDSGMGVCLRKESASSATSLESRVLIGHRRAILEVGPDWTTSPEGLVNLLTILLNS